MQPGDGFLEVTSLGELALEESVLVVNAQGVDLFEDGFGVGHDAEGWLRFERLQTA